MAGRGTDVTDIGESGGACVTGAAESHSAAGIGMGKTYVNDFGVVGVSRA